MLVLRGARVESACAWVRGVTGHGTPHACVYGAYYMVYRLYLYIYYMICNVYIYIQNLNIYTYKNYKEQA